MRNIEKTIQSLHTINMEMTAKQKPSEKLLKRLCITCKGYVEPFMVEDEIWTRFHPKKGTVECLQCLENKMGRPFTIDDFTSSIVNLPLFTGYLLGLKDKAT